MVSVDQAMTCIDSDATLQLNTVLIISQTIPAKDAGVLIPYPHN